MMRWLYKLSLRFRSLFHNSRVEQELSDELRFHLEKLIEEKAAKGMTPQDARYAALRDLGGIDQIKEECRDMRRVNYIDNFIQDVRYGLRMLARNPGFTAVAVLTLALGIGANTAIFSVIDAFLLKMIPVTEPEQLVVLSFFSHSDTNYSFSYPAYLRFQELKHEFSGILASTGGTYQLKMTLSGKWSTGQVERVRGQGVSGNYFSVLGVKPVLGRPFTDADDQPAVGQPVAVISFDFWQRRLGLDPTIVGRSITLNGVPFIVVGVTPPRFEGAAVGEKPDLWWPLHAVPRLFGGWNPINEADNWWLIAIGRLRAGADPAQARAGLDVAFHQVLTTILGEKWAATMTARERQNFLNKRMELQPGARGFSWQREKFTRPLLILMAAVGLVLLIACANVASMLLARASGRQREMAVRSALGAGRRRLICQLLTESTLLALMGGALGLLLAYWGGIFVLAFMRGGQESLFLNVRPDPVVLAFMLAASLLTGILFGLAPAFRATGIDLTPALKGAGDVVLLGRSRLTLGRVLVVSQVALSLLLLFGAGLLVRTLEKLGAVDKGFDTENLVLFSLDSVHHYTRGEVRDLYKRIFERLQMLPGTRSASYSQFGLMSGNVEKSKVAVEGYSSVPDEDVSCYRLEVGPRFFETMGISVLLGRDFTEQDLYDVEHTMTIDEKTGEEMLPPEGKTIQRPAVINEAMARYFFGSRSPIGRHFGYPDFPQLGYEIVGVVKDAKYKNLRDSTVRTFYLLEPWGLKPLELRTFANAPAVAGTLPRLIREVDPGLLVTNLQTMQDVVDNTLIRERFTARLSGFFSLFALLLACIGLYGVMAYTVARRTNEIGIRLALGARPVSVLWMVLRESLLLVTIGISIGLPAALAVTRLIKSLLFGLTPADPLTVCASALIMITVAGLAGYLPARRASRVDPMVALRYE